MIQNEVISVRGLVKSFEGRRILAGVELSVCGEKITAIIGKSGAGKSLILKHLIGLVKPDSGSIIVDGIEVTSAKGSMINELRSRMSFLFQGSALFDSMNVYDNVALPLREKSPLSEKKIYNRVMEQLEALGLDKEAEKHISELSGGMKKRVGLARSLVTKPSIVLFDEPTTGLDPLTKNDVHSLILETQRLYGYSAIIVSHEIPDIFEVADHMALLHEGRIILDGAPHDFYASNNPVILNFIEGREAKRCPLTGLTTRSGFEKRLKEEHERCKRYGTTYSLLFLLLDLNFAQVPQKGLDTYLSDAVILEAARCLKNCVRGSDLPARFRKDIFALILPNTSAAGAEALGTRLEYMIRQIDTPCWHYGTGNITIGVAEYQKDVEADRLVQDILDRLVNSRKMSPIFQSLNSHEINDLRDVA